MASGRIMSRFNRWLPLRFFVSECPTPEGPEQQCDPLQKIDSSGDDKINASGTGSRVTTQDGKVDLHLIVEHAKNLLSRRIISAIAPDGSASEPPPHCHPKTRVELFNMIAEWFHDMTREDLLLWLTGPTGVGKSAVVQTFAEYLADRKCLGASVFIPRSNKRNDPHRIFTTIAYQLSEQIEEYRNFIAERLSHDPELLNGTIGEQFEALISEPFHVRAIGKGGKPWGIVLDGLDELQAKSAQCEIVRLITSFTSAHHETPLRWIIASRPDSHISNIFAGSLDQGYWLAHVPTDSTEACETAEKFLRSSFEKMRRKREVPRNWPSYTEFLKLTTAASDVPAYAEVAMRFIKGPTHADSIQVNPALDDSARVNPPLDDSIQADPAQGDSAKINSAQANPPPSDSIQADAAQEDSARIDSAQVNPAPSDPAQRDSTQACLPQTDSIQADLALGDSAQVNPTQANHTLGDSTPVDPTSNDFDLGSPVGRLRYLLFLNNAPKTEDNPFANLDAIYEAILPSPDSTKWPSTKQLLSYCIHVENIRFGGYRLPHSFQTLRGMAIVLNLSQIVHPCLLKCYSTVKESHAKAAHKKPLAFLHESFSEYLQDPRRSGRFYVGQAEDIKHDVVLCVLKFWNTRIGDGTTEWHKHCSWKGDKTPSLSIAKFHVTLFHDVVTFLRCIVYYAICQCKGVGDPVYDEFCKIHMIKLCRSFDARDIWGFVDTLLDKTSGVNNRGVLREVKLQELKFEHLNWKDMSPARAYYMGRRKFNSPWVITPWVMHRPHSKAEFQKWKPRLESLQKDSPDLKVIIFGGVPEERVAVFQHFLQDGPHRYLIPYPEPSVGDTSDSV